MRPVVSLLRGRPGHRCRSGRQRPAELMSAGVELLSGGPLHRREQHVLFGTEPVTRLFQVGDGLKLDPWLRGWQGDRAPARPQPAITLEGGVQVVVEDARGRGSALGRIKIVRLLDGVGPQQVVQAVPTRPAVGHQTCGRDGL
jgi:hypothetical protein